MNGSTMEEAEGETDKRYNSPSVIRRVSSFFTESFAVFCFAVNVVVLVVDVSVFRSPSASFSDWHVFWYSASKSNRVIQVVLCLVRRMNLRLELATVKVLILK